MKYVAYDLEMEGEPGEFWHIFATDRDKGSLMGAGSLFEMKGPNTPEMYAAVEAICKAIEAAVEIAERDLK